MTLENPAQSPPAQARLRDAATVILLWRGAPGGPSVLMGQRGAGAAFMPSKYVFPGGALDPSDAQVARSGALLDPLEPQSARRLAIESPADLGPALACAAIRELWEETGLRLGRAEAPSAHWPDTEIPPDWRSFAATGARPSAAGLRLFFRAVTPFGRPRRFDARFFLVEIDGPDSPLLGDPQDFSRAGDELAHLHWVPLTQTRALDLPFVTEIALAELCRTLERGAQGPEDAGVPFFDNRSGAGGFSRLR